MISNSFNDCPRFNWVFLWFKCLAENKDYELFCTAVRTNDELVKNELINKYSSNTIGIEELYNDWGDIFNCTVDEWYDKHEYLFIDNPAIEELDCESLNETHEKGFIYLKVPIRKNISESSEEFNYFISKYYKANNQHCTWPKYQLYRRNWESEIDSVQMLYEVLETAENVKAHYRKGNASSKEILNFLIEYRSQKLEEPLHEVWHNELGIGGDMYKRMKLGKIDSVSLSIPEQEQKIGKWIKKAEILVENTIKGVFPKTTK